MTNKKKRPQNPYAPVWSLGCGCGGLAVPR